MKKFLALATIFGMAFVLGATPQVFATDATNFLWGADSQDSNSGQTGVRSEITIQSSTTHDFEFDQEDHNYHVEMEGFAASSYWQYLFGYTVNEVSPTNAYPWAEVWKAGLRQDNWAGNTAYTHGTEELFAIHKPGDIVTFYDGTGANDDVWDYDTTYTDSINTGNMYALAEKICPDTDCDAGDLGDSPTVLFTIAMEYTDDSTYSSATWTAIDDANMYYMTKSPSQTESSAKTEMCTPMTAYGNVQYSSTLADNEMSIQDTTLATCTSETADLWN